ncbi:hypothetical protein EGW08_015202, partial [Elysia chlorotica]
KTGLFCLAKFTDGTFYRARIKQYFENGDFPPRIQVIHIDYGSQRWVSASDLVELPEHLAKYPAQASLCALAKVTPAIDDWTVQATRLFKQLTEGVRVQMRVVCPQNKRRRNVSGSCSQPTSSPRAADLNQSSPKSPNDPSSFDCPHLVDIISKQGKKGKAVSVSSEMVKAGHAQATEIEPQLDALAKLHAQSRDRRLHGMQKMMLSMAMMDAGDKNKAAGETSSAASSVPMSMPRSQHKKIPACFLSKRIKGIRTKPLINRSVDDVAVKRLDGLTEENKHDPSGKRYSPEPITDPEGSSRSTTQSRELCAEVGKKLQDLGQAVQKSKTQSQCSNTTETNNNNNHGSDCLAEEENEENLEDYEAMVVSVISPSSFFVHPISEHGTLSWLVEGLNKRFRSLSDQHLALLSDEFTPLLHTLCCAIFSEDRCFYRGLVLDIATDSALILFIDFGDFERVPTNKLYPLPEEFKGVPPVALWCSLKGVIPPGSNYPVPSGRSWSAEAISTFNDFTSKRRTFHVVASKAAQERIKENNFQRKPLEVYLVDRSECRVENSQGDSEIDSTEEEICLNYELIHLGLADLKSPTIDHADGSEVEKEADLQDWDPMKEEFESNRNSYKINTDDPGVALVGYEEGNLGQGGQRVCVFHNRRRGCLKGDTCPNLHVRVAPDGLNHDLASVKVYDEDQSSLLPSEGTLVVVTVATVVTPTNFHVTLPWGRLMVQQVSGQTEAWRRYLGEEDLEGLMENMQTFYNHHHYDCDLTVPALGEAMAAQVGGRWVRAKVIGLDIESGSVQVASVDFGWHEWVKETKLRHLELRFLHLPPQAVACGLAGLAPPSDLGHRWTDKACKRFVDYVFGKSLIAYVSEREPSGRLSLVLYDTSGPGDLDINQALVDAGLARR